MKQNNFYEVDGCTDFIHVKLIKEHKHITNTLEVEVAETGYRTLVQNMYSFPKVNEPQKPVVPKFVAEWIEGCKGDYSKWDEEARAEFVFRAINDLFRFGEGLSFWDFTINEKISEWTTKNAYEFITAILFGYTVEKEKLYTVEIPDPNSLYKHRYLCINSNGVCISAGNGIDWKQRRENQFTESEIKQDFEWAWDAGFAKEVDVE